MTHWSKSIDIDTINIKYNHKSNKSNPKSTKKPKFFQKIAKFTSSHDIKMTLEIYNQRKFFELSV